MFHTLSVIGRVVHRVAGSGQTQTAVLSVACLLLVGAPLHAQRPLGIDTSVWDGNITQDGWNQVYAAGYVFCFQKATQGVSITDSTFYNNMERGRNAGLLMGCYHFADPANNSAIAEADYFLAAASAYCGGGYLPPVLDIEWGGEVLGKTALSQWANTWMDRVEGLTGVKPIIYCNPNYAINYLDSTVTDHMAWIAQYFVNPNPQTGNPTTGVFPTWTFWQYSDDGVVPGISAAVDMDVFNGTLAQLQALVVPGNTQPPFIVESRSGGQHYANYSETGTWSNGSSKSTAPGCTSGIGHRWCTLDSSAKTAVFRFTPNTTGIYEVFTTNCTTSNSGNPLIHRVTHANGTTNVGVCQNTTCNPNAVNTWYSLGQYTLYAGTQYTVTLDGATGSGAGPANNAGRSDAIKWVYIPGPSGPTITQQPAAQNVCAGATAYFAVAATGSGTLTYQWQKNQVNLANGGHYSGVTTASLAVTGADSSDVASYRCIVTDANGSTPSNEAALTLKASTTITQHPSNQTVAAGGTATFTVAATGDGTLSYQWQKNQVNLANGGHYSGVTTATLTISNADSNDAASYRCVVTGGCGSATSNSATLTVTTVVTIINDNFDSYATQSEFQTAWPAVGTSLTLSTARYYSSPKSLYSPNDSTARQNKKTFTETIGTDASPLILTYRLYDPGTTGTANQWVDIRDYSPVTQKQLIQYGIYSGCSTTKYSARVTFSPGNGWVATSVSRTAGWHELKIVIKSTTMDFYVDGVLASGNRAYATAEGAVSWEEMRIGAGYSSVAVYANYDNVTLTKGQ